MKLFRKSNIDIIKDCTDIFGVKLPIVQMIQRFDVFTRKLDCADYCLSLH